MQACLEDNKHTLSVTLLVVAASHRNGSASFMTHSVANQLQQKPNINAASKRAYRYTYINNTITSLTPKATSRIATAVAVVITPTSFHEKQAKHTSLLN